jgi:arylsulfatase A-like enzyme
MEREMAAKFSEMIMVVIRWLLLVLWVPCALAVPQKRPSSNPKSPNIILITLDTTRADRMGFLGSPRGLTPSLDALAKQSAVFTRAYAQVPLTPPSHATILTGTYPQFHQVNKIEQAFLAPDLPYAPDILRANGYRTAAFVSAIVLEANPLYAPGFDRGFQTYDADFHNGQPGEDIYHTVRHRGETTVAHALGWLNKHPQGPFFMWLHLYDAHDPYDPPEPYKSRYASAPYDGAIAYQDAVVGKLLRQLKLLGLYDGAIIAVTADHGESLGAHGEDTHGVFLYDETIHVPLLIKLPQASGGGKRITNRVELVDILSTLLQEAGIEIPKEVQGKSLLALMQAGAAENDLSKAWGEAYAESDYARTEYGWSAEQALRTGKYLYIQAPRRELYEEGADANAEHNLASSSAAVADTLASQLEDFRQKTSSQREAPKPALDAQAQEVLGALGYMASTRVVSKATAADQASDPKDKIEIVRKMHKAQSLLLDRNFDEAIALLKQIIAAEPHLWLYPMLGDWLIENNQYQEAIPVLRKALEMVPDSKEASYRLARSYMALKDYEAAIPELEKVVAAMPDFVRAHSYLEMAYARTNRLPDAIRECETVLRYIPNDYESYMMLGYALPKVGDPEGGIAALKTAASIQPKAPLPHVWLAGIYDQLGQGANAQRERLEAKRLEASASRAAKAAPPPR